MFIHSRTREIVKDWEDPSLGTPVGIGLSVVMDDELAEDDVKDVAIDVEDGVLLVDM